METRKPSSPSGRFRKPPDDPRRDRHYASGRLQQASGRLNKPVIEEVGSDPKLVGLPEDKSA